MTGVESKASRRRPELFKAKVNAKIVFVLEPSSRSRTVLEQPVPSCSESDSRKTPSLVYITATLLSLHYDDPHDRYVHFPYSHFQEYIRTSATKQQRRKGEPTKYETGRPSWGMPSRLKKMWKLQLWYSLIKFSVILSNITSYFIFLMPFSLTTIKEVVWPPHLQLSKCSDHGEPLKSQ